MSVDVASAPLVRRPHGLRRLYTWTVGWAERPGGGWALFGIALIESSVFPVPPDVLLLALCVGAPRRSFRFAAICAAGSVLGGMLGYAIGYGAWHAVRDLFIPYIFSQAAFDKVATLYQGNAFLAILTAAFTPIPYKVFTIAAGVCEVSFWALVGASVVGRSARFFMVAGMIFLFGARIRALIEKYFDWFAWALLALGIAGFVAIKYLK
ncbi:MAG: DedA family protein [Verrucomicrobia bacterium]|nr:DedA family protein [Verrucomicrobiota bacterium]